MKDNFKIRNEIDELHALRFIIHDQYQKMMYRWGPGSVLYLLKWYEFIEYYEGCQLIMEAIRAHNVLAGEEDVPLNLD